MGALMPLGHELDGLERARTLFRHAGIREARRSQSNDAQRLPAVLRRRLVGFEPADSGRYEVEQASRYAECIVIQPLAGSHRHLIQGVLDRGGAFQASRIRTAWPFGLAQYYIEARLRCWDR